jgi:hypothetical protein
VRAVIQGHRPCANPAYKGRTFGITQVVDGNWGVHGIVKKELFAGR